MSWSFNHTLGRSGSAVRAWLQNIEHADHYKDPDYRWRAAPWEKRSALTRDVPVAWSLECDGARKRVAEWNKPKPKKSHIIHYLNDLPCPVEWAAVFSAIEGFDKEQGCIDMSSRIEDVLTNPEFLKHDFHVPWPGLIQPDDELEPTAAETDLAATVAQDELSWALAGIRELSGIPRSEFADICSTVEKAIMEIRSKSSGSTSSGSSRPAWGETFRNMSYTPSPRKPGTPSEEDDAADRRVPVRVKALQVSFDPDGELVSPQPRRRTAETKGNKRTISDVIDTSDSDSGGEDEENEGLFSGPKPAMQTESFRPVQGTPAGRKRGPSGATIKSPRRKRKGLHNAATAKSTPGWTGTSEPIQLAKLALHVMFGSAEEQRPKGDTDLLHNSEDLDEDEDYDSLLQTMFEHAATNEHDRLHATWRNIFD
ncbi:hypothetical protein V8E36_002680 [Tilletia maclaganii]